MQSIWSVTQKMPTFKSLEKDINCDVLIIGGGITGILTAFMLKEKGVDCVICEKDRICSGTTQNTSAKITVQHGLIFDKLIKQVGIYNAQGYLSANLTAFNKLTQLCQKYDCDLESKNNYIYSLDNRNILEKELKAVARLNHNAVFKENLPLPFKTEGAVCFENQAQFHPLKLLSHLVKDLKIYEYTHIKEMVGTTAITDKHKIQAKNVIVTTKFPFINKHGLYPLKLYQNRSYFAAFSKTPNLNGMYLDENDKGFSFRNYNDALLIGCEGHRTGTKTTAWQNIFALRSKYFSNSQEICRWAAQDCISLDNMPYIGAYSKHTSNLFVATGFCKWGMTGSMLSAILLCDLIEQKQNEYLKIFSPSRNMLHLSLFKNSFVSFINLLNPKPKRCPHLGCALKWNRFEHSWDCSCHGSRFAENGKVLDGPANENKKP